MHPRPNPPRRAARRPTRPGWVLALAVLLGACSSLQVPPTPYAPAPPGGGSGYSEVWRDARRAEVRFAGNWRTDRQTVEDGLLYRAAELAAQRGAPRFAVHDKRIERKRYETVETPPFPSWWYRDRYRWPGRYGPFPPRTRTWTVYSGTLEIELLQADDTPPETAPLRVTQEVLDALAPRIQRPQDAPSAPTAEQ